MGGYDKGYRIRNIHGDVVDSTTPFQVDGVEAQETSSVAPTLTYTGKAAAGAVSIASLKLKPVIEDLGGRVGSYWGKKKNLVYEALADGVQKKELNWMTAVVETATAATVTIFDPTKNLEELFESLTGTVKRFVVKVTDKTGGVLYGWVMGVAASGDVYTLDVMNNRLTETQSWVGTLSAFDNTNLAKVEVFFYNSSLSFGTGTCFTEEVECPKEYSKSRMSQLKYALTLSNGQYFIDYWRGELFGVKADATASEVVTYNIWASTAGGSAGPAANINIEEINGAVPPLDGGAFTPGTSPVIGAGMIYDDDAVLADGQIGAPRVTINREQINAGYEASPNSNRVGRVDPEWSHNLPYSVVLTNVPNATPSVTYIDMTGYTGCSIHVEKTGGGDTFAGTFSSGNEGSASTDDFIDTTANGWSPATAGGLTADFIYHTNKAFRATAHALTLTTAGAADDADFNVFIYKW